MNNMRTMSVRWNENDVEINPSGRGVVGGLFSRIIDFIFGPSD